MEVQSVSISGPSLASLLQAMAPKGEADFDGLLLGCHQTRSISTMHDDREEEVRDVLEAHVTGFLCCASMGSFYNAAGQVAGQELAEVVAAADTPVLGWFVCRDKVSPVPSMRDRAVCAALPSALARLQPAADAASRPLIFGVFRGFPDHNGASLSFEQRFYQQLPPARPNGAGRPQSQLPPPPPRLVAVPLTVPNLGAAKGSRAYEPLAPVAGLPRVPTAPTVPESLLGGDAAGPPSTDSFVAVPEEELRLVTGTDVQIQIKGVEAVYQSMLLQVHKQCVGLSGMADDLEKLRREIEAIP